MVWVVSKKCPPGATSAIAAKPSASSLASGQAHIASRICSASTSSTSFSKPSVSPPSSQPAACTTTFAPAISAPQSDMIVSLAPCASAVFEAVPAAERQGRPIWRASWPDPICICRWVGVPKAGAPERMSTFDPNPP